MLQHQIDQIEEQCSFPLTVSLLTAISITLGGCFITFMILAFIHDPLQTSFIIVGLISFFFCIIKSSGININEFVAILSFSCRTFCSSYVILFSLFSLTFVSIYIFTFGNFNNFETLQNFETLRNLTSPLIIAILTLMLLKDFIDYLKSVYHDYIKEYHNQSND